MFDAYETDLPFLSKGDPVSFTMQAFPGKVFKGRIAFIDPIVNPTSRTSRVRVEVANQSPWLTRFDITIPLVFDLISTVGEVVPDCWIAVI